jgi:hypothetical protein
MKILDFFFICHLWVIFAFLYPDSDSVSNLPDTDPAYNFNADQDPTFTSMRTGTVRIRILLIIKAMLICDHWSTDSLGPHL